MMKLLNESDNTLISGGERLEMIATLETTLPINFSQRCIEGLHQQSQAGLSDVERLRIIFMSCNTCELDNLDAMIDIAPIQTVEILK